MHCHQPRIAIIGGGPGGLTLGCLLNKAGVRATVFERRPEPNDEDYDAPSGMLDLHGESGVKALKQCSLFDEFLALTGDCSEEIKIYDCHGHLLYHDAGGSAADARPEISRHALTRLLHSNMPSEMIKWGHKAVEIASSTTEDEYTEIVVDFGIHGKQAFDFVVGADGAWSKVRKYLTPIQPTYTGVHFITLDMPSVTTDHPDLADFLGQGSMTALAFRNGIISQRGPRGSARFYLAVSTADENFAKTSGLGDKTVSEAAPTLVGDVSLFGRWSQSWKEIIKVACNAGKSGNKLDIKLLYTLPSTHTWETKPGVSLVGDAAHLMTPFGGEGVNLAMRDSLDLSDIIVKLVKSRNTNAHDFQRNLTPLLELYEKNMTCRAQERMEEAAKHQHTMFETENGSAEWAAMFRDMRGDRNKQVIRIAGVNKSRL
ncbi:hypothetical protein E4U38_003587 [Claviceps purpurea]|nr:hypothetical protein E4U38_003587 [Claviceps purpurea]